MKSEQPIILTIRRALMSFITKDETTIKEAI
jgi:hypothetical protein